MGRSMRPAWDFLVVGAGPAGSWIAERFAKRGADVLLFDPKAPWEKPCGGGLTAAALRHTPELLELEDESTEIEELLVVAPDGASAVIPLRNSYRAVSRLTLSGWGLERAQAAGARFRPCAVRSADFDNGCWRVTDSLGGAHRGWWLVCADGATSPLRRQLAPDLRPELAPTRVMYPFSGAPPGRAVFLFLPAAKGYLWDFPRPGHHSTGIGVAPGTFAKGDLDGAVLQYSLAEGGDHGSAAAPRGAVIATSAWKSGRFSDLAGSNYVILGDAAGLADPATGEGIDYAFRSATLAADVFHEATGFKGFPRAARKTFAAEMRRARLVRRWLYRPGFADWLITRSRHSPRAALLLMSLSDAINEHGSLVSAFARTLFAGPPDLQTAQTVCHCPDGVEGVAPAEELDVAAITGRSAPH